MSNFTPSIAIIVEGYGEWGDSDREVVKRIKRANIAIDHDTAQAVAIEREAIAGWLESKAEWLVKRRTWLICQGCVQEAQDAEESERDARLYAQAIRSGEHVKP